MGCDDRASVLHIAALNGFHSVLRQVLDQWTGDASITDSNGLTAMDYAAMGQLGARSLGNGELDDWSKCRELLRGCGVEHSPSWLVANPHAPPLLQQIDAGGRGR